MVACPGGGPESPNVFFAVLEIKTQTTDTGRRKNLKSFKIEKGSGKEKKREILDGPAEGGPGRGVWRTWSGGGGPGQGVGGKVVQGRGVQGRCCRLRKRDLKNKIGLNNIWSGLTKNWASMATALKNEA